MTYQFLRIALCAVLLTSSSVHTVGKRALYDFVEAKKAFQKNLNELRALDGTADTTRSESLSEEIQKNIDEVKKLNPTKAAEFQKVLDASFDVEVGGLSLRAQKSQSKLAELVADQTNKVKKEAETLSQAIKDGTQIVTKSGDEEIISETSKVPFLKNAFDKGHLAYLSFVRVPVSWVMYPFTALISQSYKMSLRLLNFVTKGSVGLINRTYLGILQQEKDALVASIVNTSLVGALKINLFLKRLVESENKGDVTAPLLQQEKRWFLGKIYDAVESIKASVRTKDTFSGSRLHRIVIGELLEYGALLTPLVEFKNHKALEEQFNGMADSLITILSTLNRKESLTADEKNLVASLYEMFDTIKSANEESKLARDEAGALLYPKGKFDNVINFDEIEKPFKTALSQSGLDTKKMIDTRSYFEKTKDFIGARKAKIGAYKEEFAALAGLVLTIAGGSYLVESYLPQYKSKYTAYAAAPISLVIKLVRNYWSNMPDLKQEASKVLESLKTKIKQLPYSEKISNAISSSWVKAVTVIGVGSRFVKTLFGQKGVTESSDPLASAVTEDQTEWEQQINVYEEYYKDDILAQKALTEGQRSMDLQSFRQEQQGVERSYDEMNDISLKSEQNSMASEAEINLLYQRKANELKMPIGGVAPQEQDDNDYQVYYDQD